MNDMVVDRTGCGSLRHLKNVSNMTIHLAMQHSLLCRHLSIFVFLVERMICVSFQTRGNDAY